MFPIVRRARFARVPASSASRIEHFCAWKDIAVVQPLNDRCASLCTGRPIKWNPIEHRLFSEISKNWAGEPLDSYQKILRFIRSTRTQLGLSVTAHLDRRHYPTGVEPAPEQLQALRLQPGDILPNWNYTISPNL